MKKILVIQQKMIGDVLVSTILCNNLKKAYPDAQIHYMVYESTTPVLMGNNNIDKIVLFTDEYRKSKWLFFKFMLAIRKEKYDIIIDSYSKLESWLTVFLSNAKQKISYSKKGRSFLYTDELEELSEPKTNLGLIIENRLSLLKPLDLNIEINPFPKLFVSDEEIKNANKLLKTHGVDFSKKTVMISIIGSSDIKTYPLNYMSEVVDFIADNTDVNILFNYIPNQIKEAKEIFDTCKKTSQSKIYFDVLGGNLREFIALMNACDMIIGNDGGAINMAKALNKPSFIFFSPWIEKEVWSTFEDGKTHKSVHLKDYKPELLVGKSEKYLKKNSLDLYKYFKPSYFLDELKTFIGYNLIENNVLSLKDSVNSIQLESRLNKLSILIITLNEIKNIEQLIKNVSFADEIIIVDSFSTDGTVEAIQKYKHVKLIQHQFVNFSDQRNYAIQQASNDWVLFIDADERISKDLQEEIIEQVSRLQDVVAYAFYRKFYFKNSLLKFSGYQTNKSFRLFNKNFVKYCVDKFVHETLIVNGKTKSLSHRLDHYSYTSEESYKTKIIKYAQLRAKELYLKKVKPTIYHFYFKPAYRFFYHYIIRLGFLDGKNGYKISMLNAFEVHQRYVELKKLYN